MSVPARVEFVIDRLVVHGVDRRRARAIQRDLEARLEELAQGWSNATAPIPAAGRDTARAHLTLPAPGPGQRLGSDVAEALFATVTTPPTRRATPRRTPTERGSTP